MDVKQAMEIRRKQTHEVSISESIQASATLADAYMSEHDTTPLTIESVSAELNKSGYPKSSGHYWPFKGSGLYMNSNPGSICLNGHRLHSVDTVGRLRILIRLLRGEP